MKKVKDWTTLSAEQMLELPLKKWGKRKKQHYDWVCLVPDNEEHTTGYKYRYKRYAAIGFLGGSAEIVGYVKDFWYSPWKLEETPRVIGGTAIDCSSNKVFRVYSVLGYIVCSRPIGNQHDEMFFAIRKF